MLNTATFVVKMAFINDCPILQNEFHFNLLIEEACHFHYSIFRVHSLDMACCLIMHAIFVSRLFGQYIYMQTCYLALFMFENAIHKRRDPDWNYRRDGPTRLEISDDVVDACTGFVWLFLVEKMTAQLAANWDSGASFLKLPGLINVASRSPTIGYFDLKTQFMELFAPGFYKNRKLSLVSHGEMWIIFS